jgi:hypothetical protein
MSEFRRHPTAAAILAVGGLALIAAVIVWRTGWFRPSPQLPDSARMAASATISPRSHYFGDVVDARLELLFRNDRVPPSSVRVTAPFDPYSVVSHSVSRADAGNTTRLTYRYRIWCVTVACLPQGERKLGPPRAVVTYTPVGGRPRTLFPRWPRLTLASRRLFNPLGGARPLLDAQVRPLPAVTYRIQPGLLAVLAAAGSLALLLLAVALLVPSIPRSLGIRRPSWLRRRVRALTPLEQALARVRAATSNGGGDERRALEQLAVELAVTGEDGLARDARRLAWSPGRPSSEGVDDLSSGVERVIGAGR